MRRFFGVVSIPDTLIPSPKFLENEEFRENGMQIIYPSQFQFVQSFNKKSSHPSITLLIYFISVIFHFHWFFLIHPPISYFDKIIQQKHKKKIYRQTKIVNTKKIPGSFREICLVFMKKSNRILLIMKELIFFRYFANFLSQVFFWKTYNWKLNDRNLQNLI